MTESRPIDPLFSRVRIQSFWVKKETEKRNTRFAFLISRTTLVNLRYASLLFPECPAFLPSTHFYLPLFCVWMRPTWREQSLDLPVFLGEMPLLSRKQVLDFIYSCSFQQYKSHSSVAAVLLFIAVSFTILCECVQYFYKKVYSSVQECVPSTILGCTHRKVFPGDSIMRERKHLTPLKSMGLWPSLMKYNIQCLR